ncbi:hypothetical protein NLU13_4365 [Sarocladium strictum]|uniref:Uncharacterized protein n=1 Tax=Sarocladium strictum TaxID=5046 RepID=A0AA39GJD5_SARSR|nr:hypothetical protein NLU13_4365 [Sarocladium strictum]
MHIIVPTIVAISTSTFALAATPYQVQKPPLDTDWTYSVGTDPWPEHPRPQLRRKAWQSLNGIWTYQPAPGDDALDSPPKGELEREVLVPSCIESGLSGIQDLNVTRMWFAREFEVPEGWAGNRVLLNFEAVDYYATVFVNGEEVESHAGGYNRFTIDVTDTISLEDKNNLLVFVHDPTDSEVIPVGKQTQHPSHIFYRSCSGIWQSVWLESAPADHATQLDINADMHGKVTVNVHSSEGSGAGVKVSVLNQDGEEAGSGEGFSDKEFTFIVESPELWTPDSPHLYDLKVELGEDQFSSYTGFRTVSQGTIDGVIRPLLNGEFVFWFGTLDQGYWPDGLHTPPSREAMVYDLEMLKDLGFNMLRKHIKIEPDLFYEACDKLGLMVIQDMPSMRPDSQPSPEEQEEFRRLLEIMIEEHKSYTSIVAWVIYNEGWAQLREAPWPEGKLVEVVRKLDSTRLINAVSGWNDHGFGDFKDNHHYASPQCGTPWWSSPSGPHDPSRIGFQGEFGGIGENTTIDHLWNVQQAIDTIPETYEINEDNDAYNYRVSVLFREFREQIERYECNGGVWTQTTDVEGEVNGLYTYDRRVFRPDVEQWKKDIESLYEAARGRAQGKSSEL